jgi:hypothetical protein
MIISDLNYLEVVQQENIVGGIADIDISFYEVVDISQEFEVCADVSGVSAFAEADAVAYGKDVHAEMISFVYEDHSIFASATSVRIGS